MRTINKPIEVIATFDGKGTPTPKRIRIKNDDDDEFTVLQISKILFMEKQREIDKSIYWVFRCRAINENRKQDFEIRLNLNTCIWYLYKM